MLFTRVIAVLLSAISLLSLPQIAMAANSIITIGVLAHRPKPETLSRLKPLVKHLAEELPDQHIRLEAFTFPELEAALAARQLDFVLTNPGHYVQLRHQSGFSGALATLVEQEGGQSASAFGGVIFTRSDRTGISSLAQLKGKRIAIVGTSSLGSYQAPAYELKKAGFNLPEDVQLILTGMPHDLTIQAVLDGRADAGMVRTGVLEEMVKEGKLDLRRLKILNQQRLPDFPFVTSTRLYPQWSFSALPHVPQELARRVAAALLGMTHINQSNGFQGFTIPADYSPVENLLRELRLPPFDKTPSFTLHDIWHRYHWQILAVLLSGATIMILGLRLIVVNRELKNSEVRYRTVADYTFAWEFWLAPDGHFIYCSPSCLVATGYKAEDFYADPDLLLRIVHPEDKALFGEHRHEVHGGAVHEKTVAFRINNAGGEIRWLEHVCRPVIDNTGVFQGVRGTNRDITEQVQAEQERRYLFDIIERSLNEIYIFDSITLKFKHANHGALKNLQYGYDEILEMTPVDIKPEITEESFREIIKPLQDRLQDVLVFETVHERADGTTYPVEAHLQLLNVGNQQMFLAVIFDITVRKQAEREREEAVKRIRKLEGIIPICMYCKNIRDDKDSWQQLEKYITDNSEALFSHGICPACAQEQMELLLKK